MASHSHILLLHPPPNLHKVFKVRYTVDQQRGISRHNHNYCSYRLFSYKNESYLQWKHCPSSAGLYRGHNHHTRQYTHSNAFSTYSLQTLKNKPCMSDNYADFYLLPFTNSHRHSGFLNKLPIHTVSPKVQRF